MHLTQLLADLPRYCPLCIAFVVMVVSTIAIVSFLAIRKLLRRLESSQSGKGETDWRDNSPEAQQEKSFTLHVLRRKD
jgi:hypothetical protein